MQGLKKTTICKALWSLLLFLLPLPMLAQEKVIGKVCDETGEGMPGVSVIVKGTSQGVVTDLDGVFNITPSQRNAVLVFSFLGYVSQEKRATAGKPMNITLLEDNKSLDEVVVVGYQEVRQQHQPCRHCLTRRAQRCLGSSYLWCTRR